MIIKTLDPENTLSLIGGYLAYYNLYRYKSEKKYGNIKQIPIELNERIKIHRDIRNKIAHEIWEIMHNNIISVNNGYPNWIIKNDELLKHIEHLKKICYNDLDY